MDQLPEELLQHIVAFLDVPPPSVTANAQEPHLENLFSSAAPLKSLNLVSKKYHRLVDPILCQFLRVHVDQIPIGAPADLPDLLQLTFKDADSTPYQLREWTSPTTGQRFLARLVRADPATVHLRKEQGVDCSVPIRELSAADQHYIDLLYEHVIIREATTAHPSEREVTAATKDVDFLSFLARKRRMQRASARSLVVFDSGSPVPGTANSQDETPAWRRNRMWEALRPFINPSRLVIIGSPANMAGLLSCYSDTSDEWAFHIPYQRVELRQRLQTQQRPVQAPAPPPSQRERNYLEDARFTQGSVLFMRYWDSFRYDEGSSLNSYGTYQFFEKRPPSLLNRSSLKILGLRSWLRSFTYTAVFPHFVHFASVLDTLSEFRALATLTMRLAPEARSTLLDDQDRISRGNMRLQDCWSELEQCYLGVARRLLDVVESPLAVLERFEPLDYDNAFLHELLNRVLEGLGPQWVKCDDRSWKKIPPLALPAPATRQPAVGSPASLA